MPHYGEEPMVFHKQGHAVTIDDFETASVGITTRDAAARHGAGGMASVYADGQPTPHERMPTDIEMAAVAVPDLAGAGF